MTSRDISAPGVVDALVKQMQALAHAASVASNAASSMESVYEAVDICMTADTGAADMKGIYDAIIALAVSQRSNSESAVKKSEEGASVYFIQRADGLVKIGFSHSPQLRLSQLKTQHGCGMTLLATTQGARLKEAELHKKFAEDRVAGEWFHPSDQLMQFIKSLPN